MFETIHIDRSLLWKLVLVHILIIALSNYLVTIPLTLFSFKLTWSAFTFPLTMLITDLTIRLVDKDHAKVIVAFAFIPAILASIAVVYYVGTPLHVAWRIGISSGIAYLCSNFMDVYVFQKIRERWNYWLWAPAASSILANIVDTFTFFAVAFYQSTDSYMSANWHLIAASQTEIKIIVSALIILPVYGMMLSWITDKSIKYMN